ncbi:MAG: type II secretion system protein [Aeromicrobium sp.]|uniref:type II secretion system F family protein n=1 Tax=Aeromicrobium sp. TaxID=1871063 RepID=UPI0039E6F9DB
MIALPFAAELAALSAGGLVALRWSDPAWTLGHRLDTPPPVRWPRALAVVVAVLLAGRLAALLDGLAMVVVALTLAGVVAFALAQARRSRARRRAAGAHEQVAEAVDVIAAELRAGIVPHRALVSAAADLPVVALPAQVAAMGGDVAAALRHAADEPGCGGLRTVAAAWQVSETCGAPLSAVLDRVARSHRFETDLRDEVRSAVEPARATGRLLAVLPLIGLLLGSAMGADPIHVVTQTLPGALCLALGAALACLGVRWIESTATRAEAL